MAGFLLLAVLIGCLLPVQTGVNAELRTALGNPIATALVSFGVGTASLLAAVLWLRIPVPLADAWSQSAWWQWSGGLIGRDLHSGCGRPRPSARRGDAHRRRRRRTDARVAGARSLWLGGISRTSDQRPAAAWRRSGDARRGVDPAVAATFTAEPAETVKDLRLRALSFLRRRCHFPTTTRLKCSCTSPSTTRRTPSTRQCGSLSAWPRRMISSSGMPGGTMNVDW